MSSGLEIYITDAGEWRTLNLCPNESGAKAARSTELVVEGFNEGEWESAGFHFNRDAGRWETDAENFRWWKEIEDARLVYFNVLGRYGYEDFMDWLCSDLDVEADKEVGRNLSRYADHLREVIGDGDDELGYAADALAAIEDSCWAA